MALNTECYNVEPGAPDIDVDINEIVERGMLYPPELEQMLARIRR
ncbi:hypothetical protein [Amycolatopsis sp. cmx-11-51]